ncbi:RCC1 domain-containing protein [Sorangium sp. So ce145]|uniref:RCC1 domain-containing protein n=1 Tax=Sorangium sp. So ce145 TaxID=3133285 RepID=UPI003F629E55
MAGGDNTCVVGIHGHVACWGSAETGQLGLGSFVDHSTPTWIPGLDRVVELAIGDLSMCARRLDGTVWCWGMNYHGQLGVPTADCPRLGYPCSAVPVQAPVTGAVGLAAGAHHACAVLAPDGDIQCWGAAPQVDATGFHALSVATGYGHACVLFSPARGQDPVNNVVCYGDNGVGQLGLGPGLDVASRPITRDGALIGFMQLAAGRDFTCGIDAIHQLFCWGQNQFGGLGWGVDGNDSPEWCPGNGRCATQPVRAKIDYVKHVAAYYEHACAVRSGGSVYCWGTPSRTSPATAGECRPGSPDCAPVPRLVSGVVNAATVALGNGHACALTGANDVYCWGLDTHGQLGRGPGASFEATPVRIQVPWEPRD